MSRRKPPAMTMAQRDDFFAVAATLRAEVEKKVLAAVQSQTEALSELLKLQALFGQPPTQTLPTPASGWRSVASFDPSRKCLAVVGHPGMLDAIRIVHPCADGEHWRSQNGFLYGIEEIRAWAPIPEWTGEVAE